MARESGEQRKRGHQARCLSNFSAGIAPRNNGAACRARSNIAILTSLLCRTDEFRIPLVLSAGAERDQKGRVHTEAAVSTLLAGNTRAKAAAILVSAEFPAACGSSFRQKHEGGSS
jgi:hypothetical protein